MQSFWSRHMFEFSTLVCALKMKMSLKMITVDNTLLWSTGQDFCVQYCDIKGTHDKHADNATGKSMRVKLRHKYSQNITAL